MELSKVAFSDRDAGKKMCSFPPPTVSSTRLLSNPPTPPPQ